MKIKIDDSKIVFLVTMILIVKKDDIIDNKKREVYHSICKNSITEFDAIGEAKLEAQKLFHIVQVEAQTVTKLTPKIFL